MVKLLISSNERASDMISLGIKFQKKKIWGMYEIFLENKGRPKCRFITLTMTEVVGDFKDTGKLFSDFGHFSSMKISNHRRMFSFVIGG